MAALSTDIIINIAFGSVMVLIGLAGIWIVKWSTDRVTRVAQHRSEPVNDPCTTDHEHSSVQKHYTDAGLGLVPTRHLPGQYQDAFRNSRHRGVEALEEQILVTGWEWYLGYEDTGLAPRP